MTSLISTWTNGSSKEGGQNRDIPDEFIQVLDFFLNDLDGLSQDASFRSQRR